jgi:hypothetical protein
MSCLA